MVIIIDTGKYLLSLVICWLLGQGLFAQLNKPDHYFDPYVSNRFVKENVFINKQYVPQELPTFQDAKSRLPQPFWENHEEVIDSYWETWAIGFGNLRQSTNENGFVSNYVTTDFNKHVFMWGHVFMLMYWKYALHIFPYQESLENFYKAQHRDGFISREISEEDGSEMFHRHDLSSTGPNIFPWAEWAYYELSGDKERLAKVFPVLVANKQWVKKYRTWKDGTYFANGWSSGMDNQPRLPSGYSMEFDHGHISWIDITLQQILMDKILLKMAYILGRREEIKDIEEEEEILTRFVNEKMWNEEINFYADMYRDGSVSSRKSIGAYWALLAGVVPDNRLEGFCAYLSDTTAFDRPHRIPSISFDTQGYEEDGHYWRGGVWGITNYVVLSGLNNYGLDSLAHAIAKNHLFNVTRIFLETGTIWENYAPEVGVKPRNSRPNFVGFSGISPISIFFENVLGVRADVPNNKITWDIRLIEKHGILQYPFGLNGIVNLSCEKRENAMEVPMVTISSNLPVTIEMIWEGGTKTINPEIIKER